jgi:hypothetical protein
MSFAPEKKLAACLEVLHWATLRFRLLGHSGETGGLAPSVAPEVAAIADAVHNLPYLAQHWETCDEELLRGMLADCDERYPSKPRLLEVYDRVSAEAGQHGNQG